VKNNPMGTTSGWQAKRQLNEVDKVRHKEKLKQGKERFPDDEKSPVQNIQKL